ncbi:MAG: glycosyltransferase [Candidatus Obscuribacterales bacterium]|nr:glycosyltransferase [Candidatus Obscuribacterales bacterium]
MPKRILILSASVGTGHNSAARAIEHAIQLTDSEAVVRHEDALEFANPAFRNLMKEGYNDLANKIPEVLGFAYEYTERSWSTDIHGVAFERWNSADLIKLATSFKPDIVVCTHPLPADMISWLICKRRLWAQHAVVLTDFDLHTIWLCHHYSRYFVAIDETKECLANTGYDRQNIVVSGIPIEPIFAQTKDKKEMRKLHLLDADSTCILISAGGLGIGPVAEQIVPALMGLDGKNQILAVCGRNEELKQKLDSYAQQLPVNTQNSLKVIGFTTQMDELMSAADLILGKPGGITVSEALSKGLPFVIINPIPGQEEHNSDHLLEVGAAIRCNNPAGLAYKIKLLLDDQPRLERMRQNAINFSHPRAAQTIANEVLAMTTQEKTYAVHPSDHKCEGFE